MTPSISSPRLGSPTVPLEGSDPQQFPFASYDMLNFRDQVLVELHLDVTRCPYLVMSGQTNNYVASVADRDKKAGGLNCQKLFIKRLIVK